MESTVSFVKALKEAHRQAKGKLKKSHDEVLNKLLSTKASSKKDDLLRQLHLKVRDLYVQDLKKTSTGPLRGLLKMGHMAIRNIDWSKVIWWLISHLPQIIDIALTLAPLLLL